jgi:hypothetical protein
MRIGANGRLKPARPRTRADIIRRPVSPDIHPSQLGVFFKTRYISICYITAFGLLAIDVRNGTSFLLKDRLEDAFSARAWTKSDIGPRAWIGRASRIFGLKTRISGFWPRLVRQSETSRGIWRSLNITCSQPNKQPKVVLPNVYRESLLNKARRSLEPTIEQEFAPSLHLSSLRHSGDRRPDLVAG